MGWRNILGAFPSPDGIFSGLDDPNTHYLVPRSFRSKPAPLCHSAIIHSPHFSRSDQRREQHSPARIHHRRNRNHRLVRIVFLASNETCIQIDTKALLGRFVNGHWARSFGGIASYTLQRRNRNHTRHSSATFSGSPGCDCLCLKQTLDWMESSIQGQSYCDQPFQLDDGRLVCLRHLSAYAGRFHEA